MVGTYTLSVKTREILDEVDEMFKDLILKDLDVETLESLGEMDNKQLLIISKSMKLYTLSKDLAFEQAATMDLIKNELYEIKKQNSEILNELKKFKN